MSMRDFTEGNWAPGRPYLSSAESADGWAQYRYYHPLGVVDIHEYTEFTSMRLRMNERDYWRRWEQVWGNKTLARLAREFIESKACERV